MNTHALVSYTRYKHAAVGGAFDLPTQVTLTIQYYYYCAIDYFGQFHCIIKLILMHVHALQWRPGGGCVHGRCVCVCVSQCTVCATHVQSHCYGNRKSFMWKFNVTKSEGNATFL